VEADLYMDKELSKLHRESDVMRELQPRRTQLAARDGISLVDGRFNILK
jgi:hypothetical protein